MKVRIAMGDHAKKVFDKLLKTPEAEAISLASLGDATPCRKKLQTVHNMDQKMKLSIQLLAWKLELIRLQNESQRNNENKNNEVEKEFLGIFINKAGVEIKRLRDEGVELPSDSDYADLFDHLVDLVDPRPTVL